MVGSGGEKGLRRTLLLVLPMLVALSVNPLLNEERACDGGGCSAVIVVLVFE